MGSKIRNLLFGTFVFAFSYFGRISPVFAQYYTDPDAPPLRIKDAEWLVPNAIVGIWALSIPLFIFMIVSIGLQYMASFGDENKTSAIKDKIGRLVLSAFYLFGGWVMVAIFLQVLGIKSPDSCLQSGALTEPVIHFFFPIACN